MKNVLGYYVFKAGRDLFLSDSGQWGPFSDAKEYRTWDAAMEKIDQIEQSDEFGVFYVMEAS